MYFKPRISGFQALATQAAYKSCGLQRIIFPANTDFTKEKCVYHEGREVQHTPLDIGLHTNQMFPLEFGVTAPEGSSSIS